MADTDDALGLLAGACLSVLLPDPISCKIIHIRNKYWPKYGKQESFLHRKVALEEAPLLNYKCN